MYTLKINIDLNDWNDLQSRTTGLPIQEDEILSMLESIAKNGNVLIMLTSEGKQIARLIHTNNQFKQMNLDD